MLVGLGALSLVAAVAVFAAVSWSSLAAWAQGALIVGLTGAVVATAAACRRRHLVATSESLGAVGLALGLADVQVARVGLDGMVADRWVWALGVAVVAAGALALGRRTGIRVLALGGAALAFAPLVVAASGGRPLAGVGALALQAIVGGTFAASRTARRADHRLERIVLVVGSALSWCGAVVASMGLAVAGLTDDPVAHPVGPALVLAALAAATVTFARRLPETETETEADGGARPAELIGGAGTALAFVPGVLLAVGSGSILGTLAVTAAQAVAAFALAGTGRTARGERVVLPVGGATCWALAAVGSMALAGAHLLDDDPATSPLAASVVLGVLAVASIAVGRIGRTDDDLVAGLAPAGVVTAFVPALLVAASASLQAILVVLAVEAVVGLAAALSSLPAPAERTVAAIGGAVCWIATAGLGATVGGAHALDGVAETSPVAAALVLAVLAACSIGLARTAGSDGGDELVGVLGASGTGLALVPGLLVAASGSVLTFLVVLAVQAVVALAVAHRLTPAERGVATVGGAVCWLGSAAIGVAVGGEQALDGLSRTSPLGAASVLAGLAACTVALGRLVPRDDQPLGAAGTALAFVPGLLVASGTGSVVTVLAVVAGQAVVAFALAGWSRGGTTLLASGERTVAVGVGWALWITGAAGGLLHAALAIAWDVDELDPRLGSLLVLVGLAAGAVLVGRLTDRVPLTAAGAGAAFVPVPLLVLGVVSPTVVVAVLLGEALAAALLATVVRTAPVRSVLIAGGVVAWTVALVGASLVGLAGWLADPVQGPAGTVALLVGLAAVAAGAALLSGWDRAATGFGLGAAVVPVLLAVALAAGGLSADGWVATMLVAAALVALGLGLLDRVDGDRPWTAPWGVTLIVGAALAVVPARVVVTVMAALADRATTTSDVGADVVLADWLRPALSTSDMAVPGWPVVAQLAGAAGLAGAVALLHRRAGRVLGALVAVGALVVVPVAVGLTVAQTVVGLGTAVVATAAVVRLRSRDPELLGAAAATIVAGTAVAMASAPWTVGWTVLVGLVMAALSGEVVIRRSPDGAAWVGATVFVVLGGVALDAWLLGAAAVDGLLAVAVAAAVLSPLAAVLERRDADAAADVLDTLVGLAQLGVLLLAPVVAGTLLDVGPFLAVVGVTAAGAALRPRRRPAWLIATASAVLLLWVQAGRAELDVVEAYTLPLAVWALLVGGVMGRRLGSWERCGIGLVAAAGPTTILALIDPDPIRTVGVVAVGAAVAVWGASARLQAPLAVGAGAVAVLAVRHLGPVSVELPRYVTFAVAGLVLLAVGATFEQRRQDLRQARESYGRLR